MRKIMIVAAAGLTISFAASRANAQVDLTAYADAEGYIDVQALTSLNLREHGKTRLTCSPRGIAVGTTTRKEALHQHSEIERDRTRSDRVL